MQNVASNSFGINLAGDTFCFEIKILLQQIEVIEQQISEIDDYISQIVKTFPAFEILNSIPGLSDVLSASIISEIYDISRFKTEKNLVAYAGLDASVHNSGQFSGTKSRISKRGSAYLRRALWLAANTARIHSLVFKNFYQKKLAQGKHKQVALGAVARKLTVTIFHMLKDHKTFDPNYTWSS
jgi:transposase